MPPDDEDDSQSFEAFDITQPFALRSCYGLWGCIHLRRVRRVFLLGHMISIYHLRLKAGVVGNITLSATCKA
jgi:hypothetical protein